MIRIAFLWFLFLVPEEMPAASVSFECPTILSESQPIPISSHVESFIMDRRLKKTPPYEYGFIGVGVLDRRSGRFDAELPDDPESAVLVWTLSGNDEYFVGCQEKRGAFLLGRRVQGPGKCKLHELKFSCELMSSGLTH